MLDMEVSNIDDGMDINGNDKSHRSQEIQTDPVGSLPCTVFVTNGTWQTSYWIGR